MVECLAQIAGLQVISAAEDRLVQKGEEGLGSFAGRATDLAGTSERLDEPVEPLAVAVQLVLAINSAGDQAGLQERELAEAALLDPIEQPLFQFGKPHIQFGRTACDAISGAAGCEARQADVVGDEGRLLRRGSRAGNYGNCRQPPKLENLELLCRSHRSVCPEVSENPVRSGFSTGGTLSNHNNSRSRNDDAPWGNSAGKCGPSDYGSSYWRRT